MNSQLAAALQRDDVSRETIERLHAFVALVEKWTVRINLVSPSSLPAIWSRHVVDSAQLFPLAPSDFLHWADLGSGAGFPGIVIAILAAERAHPPAVTLIESDQRKAAFLHTAVRELDLKAQIIARRAEAIEPLEADVVSARALGPLVTLLPLAHRHLRAGGMALFPKGRRALEETSEAQQSWRFELSETPSMTDPDARILRIERIERA